MLLFLSGLQLGLLDLLLSSFFGFQSYFGCIFVVFFYIFLLSKGDSWNPINMKLIPIWCWLSEDEVFATTRSLSNTLVFVASPQLTTEIHLFLLLAASSSGSSPWFIIILGIGKNPKPLCFPLLLEQPTATHNSSTWSLLSILFVYTWGTPRWRIVTVAKLLVRWVKPSNKNK